MKNEIAVEVRNLEKKFGDFIAVDKINFSVQSGKIFGFLGPNGAGKSTTIRMLCGILIPTSGSGIVSGYDIFTQSELIKTKIGYMSQKFSLYEDLTVEENINFYSGIYNVPYKKRDERKEWIIDKAGLKEHRNTITRILSPGWKQRLALGCAILHRPSILFLDEPTGGVDPNSRRLFWNWIYDLVEEGVTVFVSTHYMDEAEYFDSMAFIYQGKIIAMGSPETLKHEFMKDDVLELFCDSSEEIMQEIKALPSVKEVALFGRGLHLVVKNKEEAMEQIKILLKQKNSRIESLNQISPSLEDVFVSLIESHDEKGKA